MSKNSLKLLLSGAIVLVYALLIGCGAYFQYYASIKMFPQVDGGTQEFYQEYLNKANFSETLKEVGRCYMYAVAAILLALAFLKKITSLEYAKVVGSSLLLGLLLTAPWQIISGRGIIDYFLEQFVLIAVCIVGFAIILILDVFRKTNAKKSA